MTPEKPAQGILKIDDWGRSRMYKIECDCHSEDCSHTIDIEADEHGTVTVTTFTTQKTDFWSESIKKRFDIENEFLQDLHWRLVGMWNGLVTRLRLTWTLWTQGYVKYEASIILREQVALNYADALKSAVKDVKEFRNQRKQEKSQ
jgi:hypothetical protein